MLGVCVPPGPDMKDAAISTGELLTVTFDNVLDIRRSCHSLLLFVNFDIRLDIT